MRRMALCAVLIACGGSSESAQLSVGGNYPTTVALVPGGSCTGVQTQNNTTAVAHSPGAGSLTLTHAGNSYAGTVTPAGAFTVAQTPVSGGAFTVSMTGQFSTTGFTATVQVVQQSPACQYDVSWTGTKTGAPNTIP
jgi:hypothetical protein